MAWLGKAEKLLATLDTTPEPLPPEPNESDREVAAKAMWDWYLEWSTVARQAITDRNVLRSLGFLRKVRGGSEDDFGAAEADDEPAELAPQPRPAVPEPPTA